MNKILETIAIIKSAYEQRQPMGELLKAHRLFNGFYEGSPGLVLDQYGQTLVVFDHKEPGESQELIEEISRWALENVKGIKSVLLKQRLHPEERMKNGILIAGSSLPDSIIEFGVSYALDLQMNQDASFYLDTRNLRRWLLDHMAGLSLLNTFAYTGSLGVAAGAGGATKVIQTDIKRLFLDLARKSWDLNKLPKDKTNLLEGDFFKVSGKMRLKGHLFDCVILDPPFFSTTDAGKVDLEAETSRLVNKVRPLVAHEGRLVVINNALFFSGAAFMEELNALCKSKYLSFEQIIPVPPDVTGYPETIVAHPPADPAPFNHPTKIAILGVVRKDERK